MSLIKSKKNQTISELEDYYSNKKNRAGMAWVMAFLSLVVTIAVLSGLFFGGRWIYRSITHKDNENTIATVENDESKGSVADNTTSSAPSNTNNFPSVVSNQAASTSTPSAAGTNLINTNNNPNNPNSTSKGSTEIPNTGSGEILLAIPVAAAIVGYYISVRKARNQ